MVEREDREVGIKLKGAVMACFTMLILQMPLKTEYN
jgi:hypothetical protein